MKNSVGYRIFFRYLELIWEENKKSNLGGLLGGMSLLDDDSTADPAYAGDWDKAVESVSDKEDVYKIGIQFLEDWLNIGYEADIYKAYSDMKENKRPEVWQQAINDVTEKNDDPYLILLK